MAEVVPTTPPPAQLYVDGCPGCAMDRKKAANKGIPYKEFFFVAVTTIASALPISSLFPFLYFMIEDLHVAKKEQDIGLYAGFLGASYFVGRFLVSFFWGVVADRVGRKPIIIFSVASVVVFNTLFGLSVQYWMAITTRLLLGALNGMLAPIKAYSIEICRPEHHALGLSVVSTAWGLGLIVGPSIGGYLAQVPARQYPNVFSEESIFGRFPYLLPCLSISIFSAVVLVSCIWLPETLHKHKNINSEVEMSGHSRTPQTEDVDAGKSLYKNWPLMSSIIAYCVFTLHDTAYTEILSLWTVSDKKYGGLGFSSKGVGQLLAIAGSKLGLALYFATILKAALGITILTGTSLLQNYAVAIDLRKQPQHQRGAANGVAATAMSFFKAIGPAGAGALFSWTQKRQDAAFFPGIFLSYLSLLYINHQLPRFRFDWDHMLFFILNLVQCIGLVLTLKPFLAVPKHYK
ncbi:Protein ZINC INDUCED FACILITATOR-LIKE 1 [Zea mays]|uniref:Protein ZINC INDUCED FACILITATOR-LIKE 1 n=1 Tax=Zea mays TaxID=4577 RepID=A0A3L6FC56_MAIZE|nr:Protein ZINC INDUCED FACILITATOR-LIKE 1 [Zea mays]